MDPLAHKCAAGFAWASWFAANIKEINEYLQFIVLALAIISTVTAFFFRRRKP